ncbi:MAG: hypothetical protein ACFFDN_49195 [Candidatus Hodarchaeota archaeon]
MFKISIEEKIKEFINRNRRRPNKNLKNLPSDENSPIPNGYSKNMFDELTKVGLKIKPVDLQNAKLQDLGLARTGIFIEKTIKTLNEIFNTKTIIEQESMKKMQNPLLYGRMKWIVLSFLLIMLFSLLFAWF